MWFSSQSEKRTNQNISQTMQDEIDKAKQSSEKSGVSATETLQNNIQKDINSKIDGEQDENKKIISAAKKICKR